MATSIVLPSRVCQRCRARGWCGRPGRVEQLFENGVVREEVADVAFHDFGAVIPEHRLGRWVPARDDTAVCHREDGVSRRLHDCRQLCLCSLRRLPLGYVAHSCHDQGVRPLADRGQADVDRELAAVFALA